MPARAQHSEPPHCVGKCAASIWVPIGGAAACRGCTRAALAGGTTFDAAALPILAVDAGSWCPCVGACLQVAVKTYYKHTMAKRHFRNVRREVTISRLLARQR